MRKNDSDIDNLVKEIKNFGKAIEKIATKDLEERIKPEIKKIVESRERSTKKIERILDTLLDYQLWNCGAIEFDQLITYYKTFNPEAAKSYEAIRKELLEEE